jgi:hypothetical protein
MKWNLRPWRRRHCWDLSAPGGEGLADAWVGLSQVNILMSSQDLAGETYPSTSTMVASTRCEGWSAAKDLATWAKALGIRPAVEVQELEAKDLVQEAEVFRKSLWTRVKMMLAVGPMTEDGPLLGHGGQTRKRRRCAGECPKLPLGGTTREKEYT